MNKKVFSLKILPYFGKLSNWLSKYSTAEN